MFIVDGKLSDTATISIDSPSFLFGKGVFSTVCVKDGQIYYWEDHIKLLKDSCCKLAIPCPKIHLEWAKQLIEAHRAFKGVWRMKLLVALDSQSQALLYITLQKEPKEADKKVSLLEVSSVYTSPLCAYKSLAFFDRLKMHEMALNESCNEVINRDAEGYVLEGAFSNIFWLLDGVCYSPSQSLPLYFGCTIRNCVRAFKKWSVPVSLGKFTMTELLKADSVFISSSIKGVRQVKTIVTASGVKHHFSDPEDWEKRLNNFLESDHHAKL
ncbi:MAG: hypothetical protein GWP59_04660 [Chlamydiales bacterium]|nr:aminotransferase class IV [Chlamydiales bacterium]NCF70976.1 hypothetical protein [Chlamydiales bacterium]